MKKAVSKTILVLSMAGSLSTIFLFGYLYWFALKYFRANFPLGYPTETISFYVAMFVTITTVIFQWIDGRLKSIGDCYKKLKGGVINGKGRNKTRNQIRS